MCGIFGIITDQTVEAAQFDHLGMRNTERGNLGFGAFVSTPDHESVFRYTTPFDADKIPLIGANIALGHVRAPTGEQSDSIAAIHPFETRDLLLAHNGLLLNYRDFPAWKVNPEIDVDSQMIIGGIQAGLDQGMPIIAAIKRTVEALDGQQACWLWYKPERALFLWRVMAPIYCATEATTCRFSSVRDDLAPNLLREGIIYRLDSFNLTEVEPFSYYNPFKITR